MDIQTIATAVATFLAPFTPYLVKAGKEVGTKLGEWVTEKSGETLLKKAEEIWKKLESALGDDPGIKGAAMMVSANPENEENQQILANVLVARLKENPALGEELIRLIGGPQAVQEVIANRGSSIKDVMQESSGGGKQVVKADNRSKIQGVKQKNT